MSAATTYRPIPVLLDVWFDGTVVRECCDDDLGVRLPGFAPRCACDVVTVEVRFPVRVDCISEPRTYDYPGYYGTDVDLDRSEPTTIQVAYEGSDAPFSCLLRETARELFEAVKAERAAMEISLV